MNAICIEASKKYHVYIGHNLLNSTGVLISHLFKPGKAAIISDSNVFPLYGQTVSKSLSDAGFSVSCYTFPAGEDHKNAATYLSILNFLAENTFTRSDVIIALGGGVTGDITGFAAATFLRGIPYVQIPTSLLAMVDSSVGGKTAIDLPTGKNLVGAFYQPSMVLCDLDALDTLPEHIFRDGCAEIIKYGVLYDRELFDHLGQNGPAFDREYVISRCITLKGDVVRSDEFDTGSRQLLNLGHTIGHGIEAQSHYAISHGMAVAAGMAIVAKAAWRQGLCKLDVYESICGILDAFGLPKTTAFSADELYKSALSDKKRSGGTVNLIVPLEIGKCTIQKTPAEDVKSFIEAGL